MTTIGVAIVVPEPWAAELQEHRADFGDPRAASIPAHVTLVPPTVIPDLDIVTRHLTEVAHTHPPFRMRLRGTATFRPVSPVVFIAVAEGISQCELLAGSARRGPLAQELVFPYHPHVTVAHHLEEEALDRAFDTLADYDIDFEVSEFHLYLHGADEVWRPAESFPLTGDPIVPREQGGDAR